MRSQVCAAAVLVLAAACRSPEPERPRTEVIEVALTAYDAGPPATAAPAPPVAPEVDAGSCVVRVLAMTDAAVRAGPRSSPAREATMQRLDPKTASAWRGRDHALQHLLCTYRVEMNGAAWTYVHLAGEGLFGSPRLDPASCSTPESQQAVEARIREFTHECADPPSRRCLLGLRPRALSGAFANGNVSLPRRAGRDPRERIGRGRDVVGWTPRPLPHAPPLNSRLASSSATLRMK